jgi:hypothetical protein
MKKRNLCRILLFLWTGFTAVKACAQGSFTWQAHIDTVRREGFYQVLLTPEVVAKCDKADLADLRLFGSDNRFVSYVLKDSRKIADTADWLSIPAAHLVQKDSNNKHSYIDLRFTDAYEIDRLGFSIREPMFYKREALLFAEGDREGEWTYVTSITLAPRDSLFPIPMVKTRRLRIDIGNADNAPLVVDRVAEYQRVRSLIAYLKAGIGYRILTGNTEAAAPQYDLKYFTDSLNIGLTTLTPGIVQPTAVVNGQPAPPSVKTTSGEHSGGLLLWSILLAILILLIYFSVRMVRSITQKEGHDRI